MDDYFITKKAVEIIQDNINDHFVKCIITLSINDRYTNDIKLILGIIELLKTYMETRRNDILSSCIKYTNKSYYLHLTDSLFRIIQGHLTFAKYNSQTVKCMFITDLIEKHKNPIFSNAATLPPITRNFNDNNSRNRFNTCVADASAGEDGEEGAGAYNDEYTDTAYLTSQEPSKDAGTLFREAYYKLNKSRNDVELRDIKNSSKTDLL